MPTSAFSITSTFVLEKARLTKKMNANRQARFLLGMLFNFTDLALEINPDSAGKKDAQSTNEHMGGRLLEWTTQMKRVIRAHGPLVEDC